MSTRAVLTCQHVRSAANSERSAALLSTGDGKLPSMTTFFLNLAAASSQDKTVEASVDEDFCLTIKKLWKKDAMTRLKGLQQIMDLLEAKAEEDIKRILPFWPRNLNRLAVDSERRVREATFLAHKRLCAVAGRNLAPFVKSVLATWVSGMFDIHAPVASAARAAFETAFPVHKHAEVFLFYLQSTFQQLRDILFSLTAATVPDAAELDQNEKEAKLMRMLTGALRALTHIVNVISQKDDPPDGKKDAMNKLVPLVTELAEEPRFWKFAKHTEPCIKEAFYSFLNAALAEKMVLDLAKATKVTLGCLAEQDPTVCVIIWKTSLHLLEANPDCWQHINIEKAFLPQLNTMLRNRAFGTASVIFPILLPLYVQIPEGAKYRDNVLASIRDGLMAGGALVTPMSELNATAIALLECIRYEMVHRTERDTDIVTIYTEHLAPLIRVLLIAPESASENSCRVRQSCIFAELQALLLFLEKRSLEPLQTIEDDNAIVVSNDKYNAVGAIWESIYTLSVEALQSGSLLPLKKFYSALNTQHVGSQCEDGTSRKPRRGVCFANPAVKLNNQTAPSSDEGALPTATKRAGCQPTNPLGISQYSGVFQRFLGHVLEIIRAKPSVELVSFFGDVFALCCTDVRFLDSLEKDILSGRSLSSEMELVLEQNEEAAPAAMKVILRSGSVRGAVYDAASTIDIFHKRLHTLLLVILSETFECDEQNTQFLRKYFERESFQTALEEAVVGPAKGDVLQACLHLCGRTDVQLFPASVVKQLISKVVDMVGAVSPTTLPESKELVEVAEDVFQLCEIVHSVFEFSDDIWILPDIGTLIKKIYEVSLEWGEEAEYEASIDNRFDPEAVKESTSAEDAENAEQIANRLMEVWAGALAHYDTQQGVCRGKAIAVDCRLAIIDDVKKRICHATEDQIKSLIKTCCELVGDDENDSGFIERLIPSSKELEELCVRNRVGDRVISLTFTRVEAPVVLEDGEYLENTGCEQLRSACRILLEVCLLKKATHLIDINFLLLANLIEPQARLKPVLSALVEDTPSAARLAMEMACREEPHWRLALDSFLAAVEALRPNSVWRWTDFSSCTKEVFIQYERDEKKVAQLLDEIATQVMASYESGIDPSLLCLAARCLSRASGEERDACVVKLLKAVQGLKEHHSAFFEASSPNNFHLAVCRFFIAVLTYCRPALEQPNWDFVLLTFTWMLETFPWRTPTAPSADAPSPATSARTRPVSRVWLGCAIALTELIVLMSKLSSDEETNDDVPYDVRHEWKNFYQAIVAQTLVPLMTIAPRKLSQYPGILLENMAQIFSYLDPQQMRKQWPDGEELEFGEFIGQISGLLIANSLPVQLAAYAIAVRIVGEAAREHDEFIEENNPDENTDDDRTERGIPINKDLLDCLKDASVSASMLTKSYDIDAPLSEASLRRSDRAALSGYLLTCSLLLQFCIRATREFRSRYIQYLEEQGHLSRYLRTIFVLLPRQPPSNAFRFNLIEERPTTFAHVTCWALLEVCSLVPGVVRSWYTHLTDGKQAQVVERITVKYVSPMLIERELSSVRKGAVRFENVSLTALPSTREIQANYIVEDVTKRIEISIQMDAHHPLKKIMIISNCEQAPVSPARWRQWMCSLSSFLNENG
ncbi:hypothetical protein BIW11_12165, partial [Tropilaelaps mercedesae]